MAEILSNPPAMNPAKPPVRRRPKLVVEPVRLRSLRERLTERWQISALGLGVSFALHLVCLVILSFVLLENKDRAVLSLFASTGEEEPGELDAPIDTQIDSPEPPASELQFVEITPTTDLPLPSPEFLASDLIAGLPSSTGDGDGRGDGDGQGGGGDGGLGIRAPASAVTRGSFTVWTVPEDPEPWQKYRIVIQVKLPEEATRTRYRITDLSGYMIGTDGYRQAIPGKNSRFRVKDNVATLVVDIPGAAVLVRDRIQIQSKRLKESQTLELVF